MADWTTIQLNLRYRWKTVLMWGIAGALVVVSSAAHAAALGVPGEGTTLSGVSLISGWKCEVVGDLTIRFFDNDGTPFSKEGADTFPLPHGSFRPDTAGVCGDVYNGFSSTWNWGEMADGQYTAVVYEDGVEFGRNTFTVVTFGENFVRGASGRCTIPDFPSPGERSRFVWNQGTQHLELIHVARTRNQTRKMYWTTDGRIQRANLDGTQVETLFAGEQASAGGYGENLALDLAGGKMYWTNNDRGIYRANLDGSQVEALVLEEDIDAFALDPVGNKMYWIGAPDDIRWANLDGTQVETFLPVATDSHSGLFLDLAGGKLYWRGYVDGSEAMQRANLDGTQLETLFTKKLPFTGSFALDLTKSKVYWIKEFGGSIYRANLDDGSHVENLVPRSNDGTRGCYALVGRRVMLGGWSGERIRAM